MPGFADYARMRGTGFVPPNPTGGIMAGQGAVDNAQPQWNPAMMNSLHKLGGLGQKMNPSGGFMGRMMKRFPQMQQKLQQNPNWGAAMQALGQKMQPSPAPQLQPMGQLNQMGQFGNQMMRNVGQAGGNLAGALTGGNMMRPQAPPMLTGQPSMPPQTPQMTPQAPQAGIGPQPQMMQNLMRNRFQTMRGMA